MLAEAVSHDPVEALRILTDHGVRYVVVGGFGAQLQGASSLTQDLDICVEPIAENLTRFEAALAAMNARRSGEEQASIEEDLAKWERISFLTKYGQVDLVRPPLDMRAHGGFDALDRAADEMDLNGYKAKVASVDDLIRMKRAAGRPKDLIEVEVLGALRDEIDAQTMEERRKKRGSARKRKQRG